MTDSVSQNALAQKLAAAIAGTDAEAATAPGRHSREHKYWKFCDRDGCRHSNDPRRGFVTLGPTRRTDREEYAKYLGPRHMTELDDTYGVEQINTGLMTPLNGDGSTRFVPMLRNGGLKEFPGRQIFELNWHKLPAAKAALTPSQRAEVEALEQNIEHCQFGCYDGPNKREFPSAKVYANHVRIWHKEQAAGDTMGRHLKEAITAMRDDQNMRAAVEAEIGEKVTPSIFEDEEKLAKLVAAVVMAVRETDKQPKEQPGNYDPSMPRVGARPKPRPEQPITSPEVSPPEAVGIASGATE